MKHIFGLLPQYLISYLSMNTEDDFCYGLSWSSKNRLICFPEKLPKFHFIDFREQPLSNSGWYFIPAFHEYLLPFDTDVKLYCYTMPVIVNSKFCRDFWQLNYSGNNFMPCSDLKKLLLQMSEQNLLGQFEIMLSNLSENYYTEELVTKDNSILTTYAILEKLLLSKLTLNQSFISELANEVSMTERNLRRICQDVFKKSPSEIMRYHFLLQLGRRLINQPEEKINYVALTCGFEHESGFTRFFKNGFGITPSEFKQFFSRYKQ